MRRTAKVCFVLFVCFGVTAAFAQKKKPRDEIRELQAEIKQAMAKVSLKPPPVYNVNPFWHRPAPPRPSSPLTWNQIVAKQCDGKDPCKKACSKGPRADQMEALCAVTKVTSATQKDLERRRTIRGGISAGVSGDQNSRSESLVDSGGNPVKDRDRLQVTADFTLQAGGFPNELKATWGAQVRYDNGAITEDVTKARISFDRYVFRDRLEVFAFVERFTNSFMSIDQRWENGLGADLEWTGRRINNVCHDEDDDGKYACPGVTKAGADDLVEWAKIKKFFETERKDKYKLRAGDLYDDLKVVFSDKKALQKLVEAFEKVITLGEKHRVRYSIRNRTARVELSLSTSVFREAERFEFETFLLDAMGQRQGDPIKVSGTDTLTRLSIRPSVRFRTSDRFEVRLMVYYKDSLSGDQTLPTSINMSAPTIKDYRIDGVLMASFKVGEPLFASSANLNFGYNYHRDNSPPFVDPLTIDLDPSLVFAPLFAEDTHSNYSLNFGIKW